MEWKWRASFFERSGGGEEGGRPAGWSLYCRRGRPTVTEMERSGEVATGTNRSDGRTGQHITRVYISAGLCQCNEAEGARHALAERERMF